MYSFEGKKFQSNHVKMPAIAFRSLSTMDTMKKGYLHQWDDDSTVIGNITQLSIFNGCHANGFSFVWDVMSRLVFAIAN